MAMPLAPPPRSGPPAPPTFIGPPVSAIPPPSGPTMGFAVQVSAPPGGQPLISHMHHLQPAVPLVQPAMPMAQPAFHMLRPIQQPMIQPMMQPIMQPDVHPMMQQQMMQPMMQPAFMPSGPWPSIGAQPAGFVPVPMHGGVSHSQPQHAAQFGQPVSAPPKPTHAASPHTSAAQPAPESGTPRKVHFEDEIGTERRAAEAAGSPSTGVSEQDLKANSHKKRRLEDAVDWIYDHTVGKCQLCGEHGHLAPACHKLKEGRPPMAAAGPFTDDQSKWQKMAGELSFICQNLLPDPDCNSLSHALMLQHLLELLCENEHNTGRVYRLMRSDLMDKKWFCVRSACKLGERISLVDGKCASCLAGKQLVNFCLQIQPRKDQLAMYREIHLVKA